MKANSTARVRRWREQNRERYLQQQRKSHSALRAEYKRVFGVTATPKKEAVK